MSNNAKGRISAVYRVQLTPDFGFKECSDIVPYLAGLGITHLYSSPYFQASKGSTHGYDVVDHSKINTQLGGDKGWKRFFDCLRGNGMGNVLDIVPNHMFIGAKDNSLWWDVLKKGRGSEYCDFFDIDWQPPWKKLQGKVLLAVLGERYGKALHKGDIKLKKQGDEIIVSYMEKEFPLSDESAEEILEAVGSKSDSVDNILAEINNDPERLHKILNRQHYLLSYWRAADTEINYRRFFSIDTLAGIKIENRKVFDYAHRRVLEMANKGQLDGLRIDHIDGLRDPKEYLAKLREKSGGKWIVVEKILASDERLPRCWSADGTTGYDFLGKVNGLFVDRKGEKPLSEIYRKITGISDSYDGILYERKLRRLNKSFGGEIIRLTSLLADIAKDRAAYCDITEDELTTAVRQFAACFPVYRSYIRPERGEISEQDRDFIKQALEKARLKNPDLDPLLWDFLRAVILLEIKDRAGFEFVAHFQQLTGAVMAKGAEDTAFYCYNRLVSLNEVGSEPSKFGVSVDEFHNYCSRIQEDFPETMLTTSTHDTKRSEDVRIRINLLSEIPDRWSRKVTEWMGDNKKYRRGEFPDRNTEYFLYQTLVGAAPIDKQRLTDYMIKAVREAKVHTSWKDTDEEYENILKDFISDIYSNDKFIKSLNEFVDTLLEPAWISSLSQTLIKYTAPGIPDLYQGTELWDLSLVDPDNRRAVDYNLRKKMLEEVENMSPQQAMEKIHTGITKMYVIYNALKVRRQYPESFGSESSYESVDMGGGKAGHLVAFQRNDNIVTVVPRLLFSLENGWDDTTAALPRGKWINAFTKECFQNTVRADDLFRNFPVALLTAERS